jgi:hypothetical protein
VLIQEVEELCSSDQALAETVAADIEVPDLGKFLAERQSSNRITKPAYIIQPASDKSLWTRLLDWRIPQLYAPVLAAAALAVIVIRSMLINHVGPAPAIAKLSLESQAVDAGALILNITRGGNIEETPAVSSQPREAALLAIAEVIKLGDSGLVVDTSITVQRYSPESRSVLLLVADSLGRTLGHFQASYPALSPQAIQTMTGWVLALPSRDLYTFAVTADTMSLVWTNEMGVMGCGTITYRRDTISYEATKAVGFVVLSTR